MTPRDGSVIGTAEEAGSPSRDLRELTPRLPRRLEAHEDDVDSGLAQLVLTLVELIRQILEKQAVRRMEGGKLTDEEVERLGRTLMRLDQRMEELKDMFDLEDDDLRLELGSLTGPGRAATRRESDGA